MEEEIELARLRFSYCVTISVFAAAVFHSQPNVPRERNLDC